MGNLISDLMGILGKWIKYFDELLNNQNISELWIPLTGDSRPMLPIPSMKESVFSIHWLKNHKSLRVDGIPAKLVKYCGGQEYQRVH